MPIPEACQPIADQLAALDQQKLSLHQEIKEASLWHKLGLWIQVLRVNSTLGKTRRALDRCIAESARAPAEPAFQATFTGTATIEIDHTETAVRGPFTVPLSFTVEFSEDRREVRIPRFPALETDEFDTPLGRNRTSVWRIGKKVAGTFDPNSGHMQVPIRLLFDHSIDVPFVEEDSEIDFTGEKALTTGEAQSPSGALSKHGLPLDLATRQISLVGASVFVGGDRFLGGSECGLQITGTLSELP